MKNYKIFVLIILILVFISVFFVFKYRSAMKELRLIKENSVNQELNVKTIDFTDFFIKNVLQAQEEIGFETRLKLENMVRDLKDQEILIQWNKFVNSKTSEEAQAETGNLLKILIENIKIEQ